MNLTDMKIDKTSGSPGASRRPRKDVSEAALLPQEQPLAMPEQSFGQRIALRSDPRELGCKFGSRGQCIWRVTVEVQVLEQLLQRTRGSE